MNIFYKVVPHIVDHQGNRISGWELFVDRYRQYRTDLSYALRIDNRDVASRAISDAEHIGIPVQLFFIFEITDDELESWPAFYFGLQIVEDVLSDKVVASRHLKEVNIVQDFYSEKVFVDERVRRVIEGCTRGVLMLPSPAQSDRPWFLISSMLTLSEPVYIPRTMFVAENRKPSGTYAVQSDGRDVLTATGAVFVREHGLVSTDRCKTSSAELRWRPRIIASGELMARLKEDRINGIMLPLSPLLPASNPLAEDPDLSSKSL